MLHIGKRLSSSLAYKNLVLLQNFLEKNLLIQAGQWISEVLGGPFKKQVFFRRSTKTLFKSRQDFQKMKFSYEELKFLTLSKVLKAASFEAQSLKRIFCWTSKSISNLLKLFQNLFLSFTTRPARHLDKPYRPVGWKARLIQIVQIILINRPPS